MSEKDAGNALEGFYEALECITAEGGMTESNAKDLEGAAQAAVQAVQAGHDAAIDLYKSLGFWPQT